MRDILVNASESPYRAGVGSSTEPPQEAPSTPPPSSCTPADVVTTPGLSPGRCDIERVTQRIRDRAQALGIEKTLTDQGIRQIANALWYATEETSTVVEIKNIPSDVGSLDELDVMLQEQWASYMKLEKEAVIVSKNNNDTGGLQRIQVSFLVPLFELASRLSVDESEVPNRIMNFPITDFLGRGEGDPELVLKQLPFNNLKIPISKFINLLAEHRQRRLIAAAENNEKPGSVSKLIKSYVEHYKVGIAVANEMYDSTTQITNRNVENAVQEKLQKLQKSLDSTVIARWVKAIHKINQ